MESWINTRLKVVGESPLVIAHLPLGMRHMDLVRRNIILRSDSSLCFLDWAYAGFFPAFFEIYTFHELLHDDEDWFKQLLNLCPVESGCDLGTLRKLNAVVSVNMRYS